MKRRESRVVAGVEQWQCSKCKAWKPACDYNRSSFHKSGIKSWCRSCLSTRTTPRKGCDWVAEARADEGPGKCVVGGEPLPPGRGVLCGAAECTRTYLNLWKAEARAKARASMEAT